MKFLRYPYQFACFLWLLDLYDTFSDTLLFLETDDATESGLLVFALGLVVFQIVLETIVLLRGPNYVRALQLSIVPKVYDPKIYDKDQGRVQHVFLELSRCLSEDGVVMCVGTCFLLLYIDKYCLCFDCHLWTCRFM